MRATESGGQRRHQKLKLRLVDGARRVIGAGNVGGETRHAAGLIEGDLHAFTEIEVDERIPPFAAVALLERDHAVAQQREAVGDNQPERLGLGIEMRIERARGEPRAFCQRIDAGAAEAAGAKTAPGRFDQPRPRISFIVLRPRHLSASRIIDNDRYITVDNITIVMFLS